MEAFIVNVARLLGDYDDSDASQRYLTWPRDLISWVISLTLAEVASLDSNERDFTTRKEVVLGPGECLHYVCDTCTKLKKVLSIDGNSCEVPNATSDRMRRADRFLRTPCAPDPSTAEFFDPGAITIEEDSDCSFKTANPVPEDRVVMAELLCVDYPSAEEIQADAALSSRLLSKHGAKILHHALAILRSMDVEQYGIEAARVHFSNYASLISIDIATDNNDNSST